MRGHAIKSSFRHRRHHHTRMLYNSLLNEPTGYEEVLIHKNRKLRYYTRYDYDEPTRARRTCGWKSYRRPRQYHTLFNQDKP